MTLTEFRLLFRKLYPSLVVYATKMLGDADVEDVVQDSFMELWRRKDTLEEEAHIKSFLFKTVYTRSLNVIKHRHVVNQYAQGYIDLEMRKMAYYEPGKEFVDIDIKNSELKQQIDAAIEALPEKCRQVFMMSYLHDISSKEIAQIMGISVRTVDVHLYKALKILRARLSNVGLLILLNFML